MSKNKVVLLSVIALGLAMNVKFARGVELRCMKRKEGAAKYGDPVKYYSTTGTDITIKTPVYECKCEGTYFRECFWRNVGFTNCYKIINYNWDNPHSCN